MVKDCDRGMMHGSFFGAGMYCQGDPKWGCGWNEDDMCYDFESCEGGMPKIKCKTSKECVKTYKTYYKMYKICTYRLYKVCTRCGTEFDYYGCRGLCPKCR